MPNQNDTFRHQLLLPSFKINEVMSELLKL